MQDSSKTHARSDLMYASVDLRRSVVTEDRGVILDHSSTVAAQKDRGSGIYS